MKFRILITKTLDVPKNVFTGVYDSEEQALKEANAKLSALDADVAIVTKMAAGNQMVIHTLEKVKKAS